MKKEKLIEFCKKHDIVVPSGATVDYLIRAISRAYLNQTELKNAESCFGFWEHENSTCITCDFEERCFVSSIGMNKEEYFKKLEKLDSPRIRFPKERLAKQKNKW